LKLFADGLIVVEFDTGVKYFVVKNDVDVGDTEVFGCGF
jgi:hypothetical protein